MIDDDIKAIKSLEEDIRKALNGKTPKYSNEEKELCEKQKALIDLHVTICEICKASMESYINNFKIPMTPPCDSFTKELRSHIESCPICNQANKKWNEDAIPIDDKFRRGVSALSKINKLIGDRKK